MKSEAYFRRKTRWPVFTASLEPAGCSLSMAANSAGYSLR
jgi:hypothetical protein